MSSVSEAMRNVLNKCSISVDGHVFSKETLMKAYADFLSQTIEKKTHNVGIVLHPGSLCFDALIITYAAISNIMFNQTKPEDVLDSLNEDDIVLYGIQKKERYIYKGKIDGICLGKSFKGKEYIVLCQDNGKTTHVPEDKWRLIEPYNGHAKTIDGRGIKQKRTPREEFCTSVLEINAADLTSVIDTTTVLVMPKDKAEQLIKGISICFDEKQINLLDLVTASYCTEDAEHFFGGNPGKREPVLKLCSKVSVARKLVLSKGGNRHIGLIVMGQDVINRGETELPELIKRKSLQYVYLCSTIDTDNTNSLLDDDGDFEVFACTKEFLNEHVSENYICRNVLTEELKRHVNIIQRKVNTPLIMDNPGISIEDYRRFRKSLVTIKRNEYEIEAKENFIVHSHSLMNLLMTTPFSLASLEACFIEGLVSVEPVKDKLVRIERWASELPTSLQEDANCVVDILKQLAKNLQTGTPKGRWLKSYLLDHWINKVAIVIPKAYYTMPMKRSLGKSIMTHSNFTFTTPGKFDNSMLYHAVIVLGDFEGKRFNAFRCCSSEKIISLLYEPEEKSFNFNQNRTSKDIKKWNKRSTMKLANYKDDDVVEDAQDRELIEDEKEINTYVMEHDMVFDSVRLKDFSQSGKGNFTTEVIAVATFSDDTKAFFSRHYKAYVLDTDNEKVYEVGVPELNEGDSIIFTKNNGDTQDIVGSILKQMIDDGKIKEPLVQDYERSKEWKRSLIAYMESNGFSPREVAKQMIELKVTVQEPTIIRWLDENTHTVGPKKEDSIKAIGLLTGNSELCNNSNIYFESCRVVRKIRRRILDEVGNAIIRGLSGKTVSQNNEFAEVYEKIDSLAKVLQIDRLVNVEMELPMNVANRPVSL